MRSSGGNLPTEKCRSDQNTETLGPQSADSATASLRTRSSAGGIVPPPFCARWATYWGKKLAQSFTPRQDAALFADMLSVPNDGRYPKLELTPQQRRQKTLEALTSQMEALSRSNPILMIFEDVHWIDPTSLEALGRIVRTDQSSRPRGCDGPT
jgi:hypothetical protein